MKKSRSFPAPLVCRQCVLAGVWLALNLIFAANGAQVTLAWNANPQQDQVAGYKIYIGTASGNYNVRTNDVGNVTQYTITNLTSGQSYFFAVTAYNGAGLESNFSVEGVPLIAITPSLPNFIAAWAEIGTTGFVLQENTDLSVPNNWLATSLNAVTNSGVIRVTVPVPTGVGNKFYRLRRP